jgi:hypothetical protein
MPDTKPDDDHTPQPDRIIRQCPGCLIRATRRHLRAGVECLAIETGVSPETRQRLALAQDGLDAFLAGFFYDVDDHCRP